MTKEEMESFIKRFQEGKTTLQEDMQLIANLNGSLELLETFLEEIKIAKARQAIASNN